MASNETSGVSRTTRVILVAILLLAVLLAVLFSFVRPALAQGDSEMGRSIARTWCSNCHVVDPATPAGAGDAVPTFASIARQPSATQESLNTFLQKPHGKMPDFALSQQQIGDVVAYLLSLRAR